LNVPDVETTRLMYGRCKHAERMNLQPSFSAAQNAITRSENTAKMRFFLL